METNSNQQNSSHEEDRRVDRVDWPSPYKKFLMNIYRLYSGRVESIPIIFRTEIPETEFHGSETKVPETEFHGSETKVPGTEFHGNEMKGKPGTE
ncbi:hypothetical protein F8M41_015990 [Gigaspora margarita]|uniref:Uncharacterized protein n=1 Tax=Gigaspora margarita TaxID=4874 RepID=A0A8H4B3D7_GIGMA|nr:hypothetical protein F8M41_015990 [Gigaspora margarita]